MRARVLAALALLAFALALGLPWLARPFSAHDVNPGNYFGVYALNWERLGFFALRGLPLGTEPLHSLAEPSARIAYLSHPPGFAWLAASVGTSEAALRVPTLVGAWLAAVALFALLKARIGAPFATLAGVCFLATPAIACYTPVSYELLVLPLGLWLWVATERLDAASGPARARWRALQIACAFCGMWIDWAFGFFCVALLPFVVRGARPVARALLAPAVAALVALVLVLAWMSWAKGAPSLQLAPGMPIRTVIENTVLVRPALLDALLGIAGNCMSGYGATLLVVTVLGLVPLVRLAPRVLLAVVIAQGLQAVLFTQHTAGHVLYVAYLAPLCAAALGALGHALASRSERLALATCAAVLLAVTFTSVRFQRDADDPFLADVGATLSRATEDLHADGTLARAHLVLFNLPSVHGYYKRPTRAPGALAQPDPRRDPAVLESELAKTDPAVGVRYLWLRFAGEALRDPGFASLLRDNAPLDAWLAGKPKRRLPELERSFVIPGAHLGVSVREAWLVTVRE